MKLKLPITFVLLVISCGPRIDANPPTPDAGPYTCATWCAHARVLSCTAGKPTPRGAPCEEVCQNMQASGPVQLDLRCRTHAPTCAVADECEYTH